MSRQTRILLTVVIAIVAVVAIYSTVLTKGQYPVEGSPSQYGTN